MEIFTSLAATHLEDPERLKGYLSKIMVSSNPLLSLINDVLDMSRIESGKVKIEENECSIPVVMHDLRNILQSDIKAKRLDFFIDTVDVVLMDVQMPGMNGYEAAKAIRAQKSSRPDAGEIPIYAMTANAYTEDISAALNAGMNGHIAKPVDTAALYRLLKKSMEETG